MKKILILLASLAVFAAAAFVTWQNLPEKRYARHLIKARLYTKEGNYTAARIEYEKAYGATGKFTPYVSQEVLNFTNFMNLRDGKPRDAMENTRKFVETNKNNKEGKAVLADLAFRMGEVESGFAALNDLLTQDPGNFQGRLLLTRLRLNQGRLDLAEQQLRYLYGKYPDSVQALLPLADVLLRERRSPESRAFLRRVLGEQPKNDRALLMLVDSYLQQRDLDSAQIMLDQWQESDPDQEQQIQIRKARLYSLSNQPEKAKSALAAFREVKKDNLPALSELAVLDVIAGQYDSAISLYAAMADAVPEARPSSENNSLYLQLKNQNPARALEVLKTLQIDDKRPILMPPLLAAYVAVGQDFKARDFIAQQPDSIKRVLQSFMDDLAPDKGFIGDWALLNYYKFNRQDFWAFKTSRELYQKWPQNRMAIDLYTTFLSAIGARAEAAKVLSTLPNPTLPHQTALVQLYVASGQLDKAAALAEKLAKEHPDLQGVNVVLANYWMNKDKAKAITFYEKELALNPDNTVALNNLAWEYGVVQGNLPKAAPYLEKLKAKNQLDPRILDTIGWILGVNGQAAEGEHYERNALNLIPDFPTFQYHLAYILKQTGKTEEARQQLKEALATKHPFEERKEAEKLLAELR